MRSAVLVIIAVLFGLDVYWARRAVVQLRGVRGGRAWRAVAVTFAVAQMGCLMLLVLRPMVVRGTHSILPTPVLAGVYLWHLLVLPVAVLVPLLARLVASMVGLTRRAF